jgi:hypothetical protein
MTMPDTPEVMEASAEARMALRASIDAANELSAIHNAISNQLISKLQSGELMAKGFEFPMKVGVTPRPIHMPPEIWGAVVVNIPQCTAQAGMTLYGGIQVKSA